MLKFVKYQGAGNDFVMIDNRDGAWDGISIKQIQNWCDRRFGIGADGLIKINSKAGYDFEVDYYNADGTKSFCGNGARCSVAFCMELGMKSERFRFWGIDGEHEAFEQDGLIHLRMNDVNLIETLENDQILNTGSPHYIRWVEETESVNVFHEGRKIRYNDRFNELGINVNFLEVLNDNALKIRTYERGVEDETLSCGTGITAAALAYGKNKQLLGKQRIRLEAAGGTLFVEFQFDGTNFSDIWLIGPAERVFNGEING